MTLPLDYTIYEIVKKKINVSEDELMEMLNKIYKNSSPSKKEVYRALLKLEIFDKISVITQKDTKIIMVKESGSRFS